MGAGDTINRGGGLTDEDLCSILSPTNYKHCPLNRSSP